MVTISQSVFPERLSISHFFLLILECSLRIFQRIYDLHTINRESSEESSEGKSVGQIEGENKRSGKVIPRSGVLSSRRPTQHRRHCADIVERIEGTKIGIIAIVRPIDGPKAMVSVFRRLSLVRWPQFTPPQCSDASFSEGWFVRQEALQL